MRMKKIRRTKKKKKKKPKGNKNKTSGDPKLVRYPRVGTRLVEVGRTEKGGGEGEKKKRGEGDGFKAHRANNY